MSCYRSSPYPEDYPMRQKFKGVSRYCAAPNRYPYMYDQQPVNSLYGPCRRLNAKPFPYTNRPWTESFHYGPTQEYVSLLDDLNLRPAYTFYSSNDFMYQPKQI